MRKRFEKFCYFSDCFKTFLKGLGFLIVPLILVSCVECMFLVSWDGLTWMEVSSIPVVFVAQTLDFQLICIFLYIDFISYTLFMKIQYMVGPTVFLTSCIAPHIIENVNLTFATVKKKLYCVIISYSLLHQFMLLFGYSHLWSFDCIDNDNLIIIYSM